MAMTINTNIVSINSQRNLGLSGQSLSTTMQRLSSGLRVNSAKDDAAGLAIAERMNAQAKGLVVASRNANDGISLAQTAEGALGKMGDMLQRMRELSVQSSNATNSSEDRAALQAEVNQLRSEIDRVAKTTSFNGQKILDGSFAGGVFQVGAGAGDNITVGNITNAKTTSLGNVTYGSTKSVEITAANITDFDKALSGLSLKVGADTIQLDALKAASSGQERLGQMVAAINAKTADSGVTAFLSEGTTAGTFHITLKSASVKPVQLQGFGSLAGTASTTPGTNPGAADPVLGDLKFYTDLAGAFEVTPAKTATDAGAANTLIGKFEALTLADPGSDKTKFDAVVAELKGLIATGGTAWDDTTNGPNKFTTALAKFVEADYVAADWKKIQDLAAEFVEADVPAAADPIAAEKIIEALGAFRAKADGESRVAIDEVLAKLNAAFDGADFATDGEDDFFEALGDATPGDWKVVSSDTLEKIVDLAANFDEDSDFAADDLAEIIAALEAYKEVADEATQGLIDEVLDGLDVGNAAASKLVLDDLETGDWKEAVAPAAPGGVIVGTPNTPVPPTNSADEAMSKAFALNKDSSAADFDTALAALTTGGWTGLNVAAFGTGATPTSDEVANAVAQLQKDIDTLGLNIGGSEVTQRTGIDYLDIGTQAGAWEAIKQIDSAIDQVNSARADLGALQIRFEKSIENIDIQNENITSARARIVDADFASETANLSRAQILQQAGTAMVAQANQLPQNVLSLLR